MIHYIPPILHWRVYGTIGALKNNSIYSVGFCGTTSRPGEKVKILFWSCINYIKLLKQLPHRSNSRSHWALSWNWYHINHIHLLTIQVLTYIKLTIIIHTTLALRIWIIIAHPYWHQSHPWICNNRLGPAQDVHFFYTCSHLSALKNCALIFSTNFQFILTYK